MSERNKEVTLRFLEAMGSNDPETAGACFAPDGVAVSKGFGKASGTRSAKLVVEAIETFKTLMPSGIRLDIKRVIGEGDTVMVEAEGNAITANGTPYCNQYCFVTTLENGKIKQLNEYFCTALAERELWPQVEKLGALKLEQESAT
jgi:ketosteroid isomerase-like protein